MRLRKLKSGAECVICPRGKVMLQSAYASWVEPIEQHQCVQIEFDGVHRGQTIGRAGNRLAAAAEVKKDNRGVAVFFSQEECILGARQVAWIRD